MKIKKIAQTPGLLATVVDNLNSTSKTDALSANQGKVLNEKIQNLPEVYLIGSQVIYSGTSGTGTVSKTFLMENYEYNLLASVITTIPIPAGYHVEYALSMFGYTGGDVTVTLYLNDFAVTSLCTWGPDYFLSTSGKKRFKTSDIALTTTKVNSTKQGLQLYYEVTGVEGYPWIFRDVTVSAYLVRD